MRPELVLAVLALPVVLAGCAGAPSDERPVDAAAAPPPAEETTSEDVTAEPAEAAEAEPPTRDQEMRFEGSLALAFGVCNPTRTDAAVTHCVEPLGDGGANQVHEVEGRVVGGELTLEWQPASALTERLVVMAFACDADGACASLARAEGTSPLALPLTAAEPSHVRAMLYVTMPHPVGPAASASWVNVPQAFTLSGVIQLVDA